MNYAYAHLVEHGLDGAAEAMRVLVNEASGIERATYLKVAPFERKIARVDHAEGYWKGLVKTDAMDLLFSLNHGVHNAIDIETRGYARVPGRGGQICD